MILYSYDNYIFNIGVNKSLGHSDNTCWMNYTHGYIALTDRVV